MIRALVQGEPIADPRHCTPATGGTGLLADLLAAGYSVWPEAGTLRVHPAARLSAEDRALIREHRSAILATHKEQVRQIRVVVDEIASMSRWTAKDVAKMMRVAYRYPDLVGWMEMRDGVRASPAAGSTRQSLVQVSD